MNRPGSRGKWKGISDKVLFRRIAIWSSVAVIVALIVAAIVVTTTRDASAIDYRLLSAQPPSSEHVLGTDSLGRDGLARLAASLLGTAATATVTALNWAVICILVGVMARPIRARFASKTFRHATGVAQVLVCLVLEWVVVSLLRSSFDATISTAILVTDPAGLLFLLLGFWLSLRMSSTNETGRRQMLLAAGSWLFALAGLAVFFETQLSALGVEVVASNNTLGKLLIDTRVEHEWWLETPAQILLVLLVTAAFTLALSIKAPGKNKSA